MTFNVDPATVGMFLALVSFWARVEHRITKVETRLEDLPCGPVKCREGKINELD